MRAVDGDDSRIYADQDRHHWLLHRRSRTRRHDAGYLLARVGVEVIVLEKHADFLRDLRGDTIRPSTLELLEEFLKWPHQEVQELAGQIGEDRVILAD